MNQVGLLFPGQGSQHEGMGKSLAETFPQAKRVFDEADDALGFAISRLCFEGPESELRLTENTQPAILATSVAALAVLKEHGLTAHFAAGHSLGEYSALVAAGALSFTAAIRLVRNRGRYMQEAVPEGDGAMAALLKLPPAELDGVLAEAAEGEVVAAANLNSAEQVVIAGHAQAVHRAMQLAKARGAKRAIALPVSAPFHCPLMRPAQQRLSPELERTEFRDLAIPVINNWKARLVTKGLDARQGLLEQIPNPVQWQRTMLEFQQLGVARFIEVGPGTVLAGLVRANLPQASCFSFGVPEQLETALSKVLVA